MTSPEPASSDVTVIIPVYNKESLLERCVRSVLAQSIPPARIIIVDDKSTDRSVDAAHRIAIEQQTVEVLRLPDNAGAAHARNRGAKIADTRWLAFLDADDHWLPHFLERVVDGAACLEAGFASSGRVEIATRGRRREKAFLIDREKRGSAVDLTAGFWRVARQFMPINSSTNLVDRELFLSVGGFNEKNKYWEDHILWCRLWRRSRFVFVNEPLSQYYKAPGTLSGGTFFLDDAARFQRELLAALAQSVRDRR